MKQILLVDDSRTVLLVTGKLMNDNFPNCEVIKCSSGDQALELIKEGKIVDLYFALIDYNMPGINGIEFSESILGLQKAKQLFLVTANIQENIKQKAEKIGIHFIEKPLDQEKVESIKNIVGE